MDRFILNCLVLAALPLASSMAQPVTGDLTIFNYTTTPSSTLSGGQVTVDFIVQNLGPGRAQLNRIDVLVDNVVQLTGANLVVFPAPGYYLPVNDVVTMPFVAPGQVRSVPVKVQIYEVGNINTSNNSWERFVSVSGPTKPDISPKTPSGWSGPIVVAATTGATATPAVLPAQTPLYVSVGLANLGGAMPTNGGGVQIQLLADNIVFFDAARPPLASGALDQRRDVPLNGLARGRHTIKMKLDPGGFIQEANENNNEASIEVLADVRCPADLNRDNQVDDVDFQRFATAYNLLVCSDPGMAAGCPADLNFDGLVDDGDFVVFVVAYNQLVCP